MNETRIILIAGHPVELVRCPSGAFRMGSDAGLPLETPPREVQVRSPFWLATKLVTQELWSRVMPKNPSAFRDLAELPVDGVSFDDAMRFCAGAAHDCGLEVRLPSEAQWEYACRAGTASEYFFGDGAADSWKYAWHDLNADDRTHPVGELLPNPWGIHDMIGNVWEWCLDVWHGDYQNAPPCEQAWLDHAEAQPRRCLRGGAFDMDSFRLRSAYRSHDHRGLGLSRFGMRLIVTNLDS